MVAGRIQGLETVAGKQQDSVERLGQLVADAGGHLTQAGQPAGVDELLLPLLHLLHELQKLAAVRADEHVQDQPVGVDVGGTAHFHRQAAAVDGAQLRRELLELAAGKGGADLPGPVRRHQVVEGQSPVVAGRETGALDELAVGLDDPELVVQEQKQLGDAGQDPLGERAAGLHLLVLLEHPDDQVLPLLFQYPDGMVGHVRLSHPEPPGRCAGLFRQAQLYRHSTGVAR